MLKHLGTTALYIKRGNGEREIFITGFALPPSLHGKFSPNIKLSSQRESKTKKENDE